MVKCLGFLLFIKKIVISDKGYLNQHQSEMNVIYKTFHLFTCILQYGTTALVWAARKGHVDCVRALLESGANVDAAGMVRASHLVKFKKRSVHL